MQEDNQTFQMYQMTVAAGCRSSKSSTEAHLMGPGALSAVNNLVCVPCQQLPALPPATLASVQPEAGLTLAPVHGSQCLPKEGCEGSFP